MKQYTDLEAAKSELRHLQFAYAKHGASVGVIPAIESANWKLFEVGVSRWVTQDLEALVHGVREGIGFTQVQFEELVGHALNDLDEIWWERK